MRKTGTQCGITSVSLHIQKAHGFFLAASSLVNVGVKKRKRNTLCIMELLSLERLLMRGCHIWLPLHLTGRFVYAGTHAYLCVCVCLDNTGCQEIIADLSTKYHPTTTTKHTL